jgi:4-hydroxybenzoyl-CoA reductase subunit beta
MEYLPNFKLYRPGNVEDAIKIMTEISDVRYVAGGTDMIVNVRRGIEQPQNLIDLTSIEDMNTITEVDDGLDIGANVTLDNVQENQTIRKNYPCIMEAAGSVAGPTHQQYGTVGGNLCLDTRCLFYNQSEWWRQSNDYCLKERGDICHVAPGGKRCFAAFSGDLAPSMLVYGAEILVLGPSGSRRIPLSDLYRDDGMAHLSLEKGELVERVHLPNVTNSDTSRYEKSRIRGSIDFPLAGVAVRLRKGNSGAIEDIAIALTAVNPYPKVIAGLEVLIGSKLGDQELDLIRDTVRKQSKPMRTTTVAPWYRRRVVGAIARRLAAELSS